jgi:hypothetical protein
MRLGIAEILEQVSKQETKEAKIEMLRKHDSVPMRTILKSAFDPSIKWQLPKGDPPFKPCQFLDQENMLYSEVRRLYLFWEGGNPNLTTLKRESLFIGLLESLAPADAKLLCAAKDKKLPYKGITVKLVNEAYPGLINEQVKTA